MRIYFEPKSNLSEYCLTIDHTFNDNFDNPKKNGNSTSVKCPVE